jgi:glycosyltransferase involved in cell wall biosynthesis
MMRTILHVITGLEMGGAETALLRLIKSTSPDSYQHHVITLTPGGSMLPVFFSARIKVTQFDFRQRPASSFLQLVRMMRLVRPDIVQTWMYHADLIGGLAARLLGNRKIIWGIRTSSVATGSRATAGVQRICAWMSNLLPHTIVCVAEASRMAHITMGYDAHRMVVVHNGFNPERAVELTPPAALRKECGFDENHLVIGNLARFDPDKDLHNFVRAGGLLAPLHEQVRFLIIGYRGEPERAQLEHWIEKTGYASRFCLLPERSDPSVCLQTMDIFCLSSRNEGFPNVVGEAMAEGLPCVVTDVGDTALLVGDTGIVVAREDPVALASGLERVVRMSPEDRRGLGMRAAARIRDRFTMGHTVARFEKIYDTVMKGGV